MAESNVTFFLVVRETSLFGEADGEVKLLRNELRWMRLFLRDPDSKRMYDERIKLWVEQIREVSHDAEDVIDLFIVNLDYQRLRRLKILKFLPTCIVFVDKLSLIHELVGKIKEINVTIEKIMANRSKYGFDTLLTTSSSSTNQERRIIRTTNVEDTHVMEIKDSLDEVKKMLLNEGEGHQIMGGKVVSIEGMGGLGKTTLAKKVYNHSDVKRHFDCHVWVYASQEFRRRELLLNIINSVMSLTTEEKIALREVELGGKLCEYLNHKSLVGMLGILSSRLWEW